MFVHFFPFIVRVCVCVCVCLRGFVSDSGRSDTRSSSVCRTAGRPSTISSLVSAWAQAAQWLQLLNTAPLCQSTPPNACSSPPCEIKGEAHRRPLRVELSGQSSVYLHVFLVFPPPVCFPRGPMSGSVSSVFACRTCLSADVYGMMEEKNSLISPGVIMCALFICSVRLLQLRRPAHLLDAEGSVWREGGLPLCRRARLRTGFVYTEYTEHAQQHKTARK